MFLYYIKTINSQIPHTLSNYFRSFLSIFTPAAASAISSTTQKHDQYLSDDLQKSSNTLPNPQKPPTKSLCNSVWGAVRSTGVVLVAIIVTSALMTGGIGIAGIALAIGTGILAGTAFGAFTNAMTCMATGDWSEFGSKTFDDFKASCIGAISTAAGCGVGRLVIGSGKTAAQASINRRLCSNIANGITNSTVSTSANTCLAYKKARENFKEYLKQNNLENCSNEEKVKLYQDFLQRNGLGTRNVAKTFGFAILTSAIGRKVGTRFQIARDAKAVLNEGMKTSNLQAVKSILVENTVLTGIGLSSGVIEHGNNFTFEDKVSTVFGNYAGGMTSHISSNYIQPKIQTRITKK